MAVLAVDTWILFEVLINKYGTELSHWFLIHAKNILLIHAMK